MLPLKNRYWVLSIGVPIVLSVFVLSFQNCGKPFTALSPVVENELSSLSSVTKGLPPSVTLLSFPPAVTKSNSASVMFKATAQAEHEISSIKCILDNMAPVECMQGYTSSSISEGPHRLIVIATDNQGLSSSAVFANWIVDTTAPTVSFVLGPSEVVSTTSLKVTFASIDNGSGIESVACALDNSAVICANGTLMLSNLTEGMKSLKITATDLAKNVFNLTQSFEVKFGVPSVTLTTNPPGFDSATSSVFSFAGTGNGQNLTKFECSRDGVTYVACNSGTITYNNLPEGSQKFYVRSVDDNNKKSSPQLYTWVVDRTLPVIAFSGTPASITKSTSADFSFTITDLNQNKKICNLDNVDQVKCNSPLNFTDLANAKHTLKITAIDQAGNTSSKSYSWTISEGVAPVAQNKSVTTNSGANINIQLVASDADGDALTYGIVMQPSNGSIANFNANTGTLTYVPKANFSGADSFSFKVNDGKFDSNISTISVTIKEPLPTGIPPFAPSYKSISLSNQICIKNSSGSVRCGTAGNIVDTGLKDALSIVGGTNHQCALTSAGSVKCWGRNTYGQLGSNADTTSEPTDVVGVESAIDVTAASNFSCALLKTGSVKCWGFNQNGQLGNGPGENSSLPVLVPGIQGATSIISSSLQTCASLKSGGIKCWGSNPSDMDYAFGKVGTIASLTIARYNSCVVTSGGGAKCFGSQNEGRLGNNSKDASLVAVDVFGLSSGVKNISNISDNSCALMENGGVKCWGVGILGNGTTDTSIVPVDVIGLQSEAKSIAGSSGLQCALMQEGGVKCWGNNSKAILGRKAGDAVLTPVDLAE